jgi:hypothetical protein
MFEPAYEGFWGLSLDERGPPFVSAMDRLDGVPDHIVLAL